MLTVKSNNDLILFKVLLIQYHYHNKERDKNITLKDKAKGYKFNKAIESREPTVNWKVL